tara:strand:+ start:108 stop:713 length:606 start_codon:yes stop_codon:yes gene_type:complete
MDNELAIADMGLDVITNSLKEITKHQSKVGKIKTPKGLVKQKMGFDYVELSYMKKIANEQYPGWSWTIINSEALGTAAYVVHGRLKWFDNGIWREGDMVAAHRIQVKKGTTDFVEIGNDIKSANTDCMKKALNVYMNIAADVYRSEDPELSDKQIDTLRELADKADIYDEINDKMIDGVINNLNYKASKSKLERLAKENAK